VKQSNLFTERPSGQKRHLTMQVDVLFSNIERLLPWLQQHGPLLVFVWLALENTLFLGVIVPGLSALLVTGLLIHTGDVAPVAMLGAAVAGTLIGDRINYAMGRWGLRRFGCIRRVLEDNEEAHRFIEQYPPVVYVFFHFPLYLRTVFPLTLGSMRFPIRRWLWIDGMGALLFVGVFTGMGYGLARWVLDVNDLASMLTNLSIVGNAVILALSLLFLVGTVRFVRILWHAWRAPVPQDEIG